MVAVTSGRPPSIGQRPDEGGRVAFGTMCGRFVSAAPPDEVARYFSVDPESTGGSELPPELMVEPSWNVAPTMDVTLVRHTREEERVLDRLRWGLVPRWAKDVKIGSRMINARAETLASSGAFKHAFRWRRCLVPADGFYEWRREPGRKRKQPYFIHRPDGEPYAFAGLWDEWKGDGADSDQRLRTFTIITTTPNDVVSELHDRMPVILPPSAWDMWLDRSNEDVDDLGRLLVAAPPEVTELWPVSTDVNDVRKDGPHLVTPIDPADPTVGRAADDLGGQGTLL
jgi:putative SOS response-associated peptidase YedK